MVAYVIQRCYVTGDGMQDGYLWMFNGISFDIDPGGCQIENYASV